MFFGPRMSLSFVDYKILLFANAHSLLANGTPVIPASGLRGLIESLAGDINTRWAVQDMALLLSYPIIQDARGSGVSFYLFRNLN